MTKDNHLLGKFDLTGIPPAPRGTPQVSPSVAFLMQRQGRQCLRLCSNHRTTPDSWLRALWVLYSHGHPVRGRRSR